MHTRVQRQRAQACAVFAVLIAFAIALTSPHFRDAVVEDMVLLSEAQTLQAEAKLAAFKEFMAFVDPNETDTDHSGQQPKNLYQQNP